MTAPFPIDYADVQGTILRGYRADLARHFVLAFSDVARVRQLLGMMTGGDPAFPQITTATRWAVKPAYFLNIGFTNAGLAALGITTTSFDPSFCRGATADATAATVGDVGDSAPSTWIGGRALWQSAHAVLSLWVTADPAVREAVTQTLRGAFAGCVTELSSHDATALPNNGIHFGYRDNIAQPTVIGAPPRKRPMPDHQPPVQTGEFLLGYPNEAGGIYTAVPCTLSRNCSYSAFRILEQDVAGFEQFLVRFAGQAGLDEETVAAKVCGRWRNGNPLELDSNAPGPPRPPAELNNFAYTQVGGADPDDTLGLRCPIGSHIRRNNPRDEAVAGASVGSHRIIRRAMPYGPPYDPARPDEAQRGLIGHFINASIQFQFEFLTSQWSDTSSFVKAATGPGGRTDGNAVFNISGQDIFLGVNDLASSEFTLPHLGAGGKNNFTYAGFPRFVRTRGGAYCFLPSISYLTYLANGP